MYFFRKALSKCLIVVLGYFTILSPFSSMLEAKELLNKKSKRKPVSRLNDLINSSFCILKKERHSLFSISYLFFDLPYVRSYPINKNDNIHIFVKFNKSNTQTFIYRVFSYKDALIKIILKNVKTYITQRLVFYYG